MIVRTQLLVREEQHRRLKRISRERGISLSALLREILDQHLSGEAADISCLAGVIKDGPGVAANHDRWIYGGKAARRVRGRG